MNELLTPALSRRERENGIQFPGCFRISWVFQTVKAGACLLETPPTGVGAI